MKERDKQLTGHQGRGVTRLCFVDDVFDKSI